MAISFLPGFLSHTLNHSGRIRQFSGCNPPPPMIRAFGAHRKSQEFQISESYDR
jgi:hypothetical protein